MTTATVRQGLSEAEAARRLKQQGFNELPQAQRRTAWRIIGEVLREPMLFMLLAAGIIYLLLGSLEEALILLAFASFSIFITAIQETRTERVLEALRDLTSPRAQVIRDGKPIRIAGREVVEGDLLLVSEGDRVAADARLLEGYDLLADESLLTGESVPVRKTLHSHRDAGTANSAQVFSGTLVVRGHGLVEVTATGARSEIGKIGQSLRAIDMEPPRLRQQTRRIVRFFAILAFAVSLLLIALHGLLRGNWLEAALSGIALGMSLLPEEFPVVLTVFMAMGAWRISKARVLTRRAAAIETLGSATVLCTDKTGTLTENRMRVSRLITPGGKQHQMEAGKEIPTAFQNLLTAGALASAPRPVDPMDRAFQDVAPEAGAGVSLEKTYGLRAGLLAFTQVWSSTSPRNGRPVAAKGAPESIAELCKLSRIQRAEMARQVDQMATQGLRVLAVASGTHKGKTLPETPRGFRFTYLGLVGLADPLRESAPQAVARCRDAGIRVVMITGDYPETARAIAASAGIDGGRVLSGSDIEAMDDQALSSAVATTSVFARIQPNQKLRIVEALKARGEVVAMTGDGVNDAPSLKAAHIGVAMGGRGTDVAREASSIVLLDDDFGSIVKAISLGRRIYDNLRKAMGFIFAVHIPIAGMALLPILAGLPPLFAPIHIAFLEMIIDPVCSLAFEAEGEERDTMKRPPRPPQEPLFNRRMVLWSALQGVLALLLIAAIYLAASARGMPEDEVRALAFVTLVMAVVGLIFVDRSFSASLLEAFTRPNRALTAVLFLVFLIMGLALIWPPAARLFSFGPLHTDDLLLSAAAAGGLFLLMEVFKLVGARSAHEKP